MKILVTGPQGSGKTTQAASLAKKMGYCFIDVGDLLRVMAQGTSEKGQWVKEDLKQGKLVEDDIVAKLVESKTKEKACQKGFVLDGYPRTMESLQLFDPNYDQVFYLEVSDVEVEKRLIERGREDDTPQLIRERLSLFHQMTEPVLGYYQSLGKLVRINGSLAINEVEQAIEDKLLQS